MRTGLTSLALLLLTAIPVQAQMGAVSQAQSLGVQSLRDGDESEIVDTTLVGD